MVNQKDCKHAKTKWTPIYSQKVKDHLIWRQDKNCVDCGIAVTGKIIRVDHNISN